MAVQKITPVGEPTNLFCPGQKSFTEQGKKNFDRTFGKSEDDIFRNLADKTKPRGGDPRCPRLEGHLNVNDNLTNQSF
jgi:hypothetical protein